MKKALITGISGQDGSYLAELLLEKDYEVHGIVKSLNGEEVQRHWRIGGIINNLTLHGCDITNNDQVESIFYSVMPDEVYHLASDVQPLLIFEEDKNTFDINFLGTFNLLHAVKKYKDNCRLYCAGSSLMFGHVQVSPQNETTPMNPTTPYGIGKVAAHHFARMYREAYGVYACTGILFNHESPRRDEKFLPRKIAMAVANIKSGKQEKLLLGDIELKRDWAYAGDVVESMWLMLQQDIPDDFVIGSSELHSIKELLQIAFRFVDLNWQDYVVLDSGLLRNVEYANLCADSRKAREKLGWTPKVHFKELVELMVQNDLELVKMKK
ncbi:MAG: GDP-mannose 4,6-dehydratase [Sulfuricaulis sp.]|uniref:GDP-mannose 4,6-dehydratase n=1 Tax=Sulfuricaulis sp. TaxID=2003553 RepID=UPI0034A249F1